MTDVVENQVTVKIYPNPVNGILNIEVDEADAEMRLISSLGAVVHKDKVRNGIFQI
jgi:hypothetical protein